LCVSKSNSIKPNIGTSQAASPIRLISNRIRITHKHAKIQKDSNRGIDQIDETDSANIGYEATDVEFIVMIVVMLHVSPSRCHVSAFSHVIA